MKIEVYNPAGPAEREMFNYLLGQMTAGEEEALERRYFGDDALFQLLLSVREELIDAYVQNRLSEEARASFERHFLNSSRRREEVEFARMVKQSIDSTGSDGRRVQSRPGWLPRFPILTFSSWQWAAAAILLAVCGWLFVQNRRLHDRLTELETEQARLTQREKELLARIESLPLPSPATPPIAPATPPRSPVQEEYLAMELTPDDTRGTAIPPSSEKIDSPSARLRLLLTITFDPGSSSCRAELRTSDGRMIERTDGLKARDNGLTLYLTWTTSAPLPPGDYRVTVTGQTVTQEAKTDTYRFTLVR